MIVKIKTRKKPTFKQLLNYMLHHKERLLEEGNKCFLLKHNLKGETVEEWVKQYKENETFRKLKRPDSVILSHEILSWHRDDTPNITLEKMEEMAREYIKLRNPNGLYIGVPHTNKKHFHIHICASGLEYHTGKSLRMSKTEFTTLKKKIQDFQREKFPELSRSVVEHGRGEKTPHRSVTQVGKVIALSDTEYQIRRRTGRASEKEKLIELMENCYMRAGSREEFFELLKSSGLKTYSRGSKITGVVYGRRKFRMKRLGFGVERIVELDVGMKRNRELREVRKKQKIRGIDIDK